MARGTPKQFRGDLEKFSRLVERRAAGAAAAIGALMKRDVALATPFDTGRAAGSWNASLNGANTRVLPDEVLTGSVQEAERLGEVNLQGIRLGDSIHVSNSLGYIHRLNAGHSRQAPANFVEMTVQNVEAKAPAVVSKIVGSIR